jgi:cell division protein FtsB
MDRTEIRPTIERVTAPGRRFAGVRRNFAILIALLAVAVLVITFVRDQGVIDTWKLSRTEKQLREENERLKQEKARLLNEVHRLKTSTDTIEKRAREMGLVYPNEMVIDTRAPENAARPAPAPSKGGPARP